MLPSRSRLQGWNPESLASAAASITASGDSIYQAVRDLDDRIDRMPESRGWAGQAHDAAAAMFGRATDRASKFKNYAEAFGNALRSGSASLAAARTALLNRAAEIDATELRVTDQWVVMIDPAGMSADKAAELQRQAEAAQADINRLLLAVGKADDWTAQQLILARAQGMHFEDIPGSPTPVTPPPGDDVPNPATPEGEEFQKAALAQDMATTVREVTHTVDKDGNEITTTTMLDGSTHVETRYVDQGLPSQQVYPAGTLKVVHTDKNGNFVSETMTTPREDGGTLTEVWYAGGTQITISQNADGTRSGSCTTADGRHAVLPDSFFQDPLPTLAAAPFSGLEVQAGRGIVGMSEPVLDGLKAGAKYAGPAMGLAQAVLTHQMADTPFDQCVAKWSGGIGLAGGIATSIAVGAVPGVGPFAAMGANVAGGFIFGYVGKLVGNAMCG
ncbi:WXG100 family type VII secretion target [Mycobacterium deserti]|uniref:WXG100 family type VII secretion target n=1 Tax=Mycobacterium deserti TaxID=2978347 RepID=A0ABT2M604_9MYCO|nr:WXG100 family type VII secretion target [Mycobacterium deserti]MCT7657689.1 WXG100 family type VII secretion target [Mycobacterium deserti]